MLYANCLLLRSTSHNNNVYKETRVELQQPRPEVCNEIFHSAQTRVAARAAGDKGAKANAYQIILNASTQTQRERERVTEREREGRMGD